MIHLMVPVRTVSESNVREHWGKRHQRACAQRFAAFVMVRSAALGRAVARIELTRLAPRRLDDDNLRGALKAVRDGVADALGIDDGDAAVEWEYAQERAAEYAVRVELT